MNTTSKAPGMPRLLIIVLDPGSPDRIRVMPPTRSSRPTKPIPRATVGTSALMSEGAVSLSVSHCASPSCSGFSVIALLDIVHLDHVGELVAKALRSLRTSARHILVQSPFFAAWTASLDGGAVAGLLV